MNRTSDPLRVDLVAQTLRSIGTGRLRVFGSSMRPWLRPGDILLIRRESPLVVLPGVSDSKFQVLLRRMNFPE